MDFDFDALEQVEMKASEAAQKAEDGPRLQDHVAVDLEANPWKFEDTYNLGATVIKADDGTLDRLDVSRFSSVSLSLEALNSGAVSCSRGLCITYSSSQQCYYLLVRSDKTVEGSAMAQRFGIDAKKPSQEQPPPAAEATPTVAPGKDVVSQEQQPPAVETTPTVAPGKDVVSQEQQPRAVETTPTEAPGKDIASQEQQPPTAEATPAAQASARAPSAVPAISATTAPTTNFNVVGPPFLPKPREEARDIRPKPPLSNPFDKDPQYWPFVLGGTALAVVALASWHRPPGRHPLWWLEDAATPVVAVLVMPSPTAVACGVVLLAAAAATRRT